MTEFEDVFCFRCPCEHPTVLPLRSPLGKYEGQLYQPMEEAWPVRFLCIRCGQVSPALQGSFELIDPMTLRHRSLEALWKVDCECALHNCESKHTLYASWPKSHYEKELADKAMGAFVGLWCESGHEFCPKQEAMIVKRLAFDAESEA